MRTRATRHRSFERAVGPAVVTLVLFLEGKCTSGRSAAAPGSAVAPPSAASSPSSPSKEILSSVLSAYEAARLKAWDPARRFKALFKAEVSPKVGAIGRGYLSVWWDAASRTLDWRTSAPIAGGGRGGVLRVKEGAGSATAGEAALPLSKRLAPVDLVACILGTPEAAATASSPFEETPRGLRLRVDDTKRFVLVNREGQPIELTFPRGEVVRLEPGEGVPRRIEAKGPDGQAILTLESYGPWPTSEQIPPL